MSDFQTTADTLMCALWIAAYALCFVSTIRYKYPALSPVTQLIIAPFEFAVLFRMIRFRTLTANYISVAYICWTLLEFGLLFLMLKYGFHFEPKKTAAYIGACIAITVLMIWLVAYKNQMYFFSYFNTFIGELFWFGYILKKQYPMKALNLAVFIAKLIGNAVSVPVYLHVGTAFSKALCVLLPVLDLCFIAVYLYRVCFTKKKNPENP